MPSSATIAHRPPAGPPSANAWPSAHPHCWFRSVLVIQFEHVTKRYPQRGDALKNLSFELEPGEMVFLTGHSGAGKSTLLRLIGLLERPTRGRVTVNGRDLARLPDAMCPRTDAKSA